MSKGSNSDELGHNTKNNQKVLEEDEYLGRMSRIIRRDFFSTPGQASNLETPSFGMTDTPCSSRTEYSSTSTIRSREESCSLRLNEYLQKYTSEDNAYFEKLQKKDLKRHRLKFPWLYRNNPRKLDYNTLALQSSPMLSIEGSKSQSTVNYGSNKCIGESHFKEPLPVKNIHRRSLNRFNDKIGIDGKLLSDEEPPSINGYSFIPAPETPIREEPKIKVETNRFFIPNESPRDELARRLYEQKVAKNIRTPRTDAGRTGHNQTSSRRSETDRFTYTPSTKR